MDIQLKRGLLDVCVLAAIKNENSYGYINHTDQKYRNKVAEKNGYLK